MRSDDAMRAVVVGAGGLGGPIAIALAGGGVDVVIVDADVVELSNLHRQVQFGMADLRMPKAIALAARIGPTARGVVGRFDPTTADELLREADLVVDGSDDPPTKFLVADSARARGIPYVIASALRYGGNVFASARDAACYRCLFEDAPARDEAPTCGDSGVLGPLVGWVGGVAAERALRLMVGDSHGAANVAATIWVLDDLRRGGPRELAIARRPGCVCDGAPSRDPADPAAPAPTGGA